MGPLIKNIINTKIVLEGTHTGTVGVYAGGQYLSPGQTDDPGAADGFYDKRFKEIMTKLGYKMLTGEEKHGTGKEIK